VDDINISTFFTFYMIATGEATPRPINGNWRKFDVMRGRVPHITAHTNGKTFTEKLGLIKKLRPLTFCINDSENAPDSHRRMIPEFLSEIFPDKCQYEC
jgi:hypothetical protein